MLQQKGITSFMTGDKVIAFADSIQVKKMQGIFDNQTISQWYKENPNENHLGLIQLFGQMAKVDHGASMPGVVEGLLQDKAILEVGKSGKFSYDVPIYEETETITTRDMSEQSETPGIDESEFLVVLSEKFEPGDVLTYDVLNGEQFYVTDEIVKQVGDSYEHVVKHVSNDKETWFPATQLMAGITYFKINHAIFGEYGVNYSSVHMPEATSHFTCEFQLGAARGVEAAVTAMADKGFSGAGVTAESANYMSKIDSFVEKHGDTAMLFDVTSSASKGKGVNVKSARLASTVEILVRKELERMTAQAMMFQKAGTIEGGNGYAQFNEGLWHQMRRGKVIRYARPMGLTRAHLKEAVDYIFRENPLQPSEREVMFKVGSGMWDNFQEIFRDEINAQLDRLSQVTNLLGTDGQIPKSPIRAEGGDLMKLELLPVAFRKVHIPGIGTIVPELDTSLDYYGQADRFSKGMNPYNRAHTTYSAIIWDARSQMYSNNKTLPKGVSLVDGGNEGANIYLVKPRGEMTYTGYENGRYSPWKNSEIMSSLPQRMTNMWAWNSCALWLKDPSIFVIIELDKSARGYS